MRKHIAVAIVGFRNPGDIAQCLAALAKATYPHFEVVICENGGPAACRELAPTLPGALPGGQNVTLVCATANGGYAAGVNLCIEASSSADAWWVLNPDTQPLPTALQRMVERLEVGDCEVVGSTMLSHDGRVLAYGYRWNTWLGFSRSLGFGRSPEAPVDVRRLERELTFVSGASMLVSREFVERVGLMREDYFLYCEESEWCVRGARLGLRIGVALDAHVIHAGGASTGAVKGLANRPRLPVFLMQRNSMLMVRDLFPARLSVVALPYLAFGLASCARNLARRQAGYVIAGWWDGVRGRRGAPDWAPA